MTSNPYHPSPAPSSLLNLTPEEVYIYQQLFTYADETKKGLISGQQAVQFFAKSKLPSPVLGEIWQIADNQDEGRLNKDQFYVALKLIALAQSGKQTSLVMLGQGR
jgi:epidermal growth factor receptor substrate 15